MELQALFEDDHYLSSACWPREDALLLFHSILCTLADRRSVAHANALLALIASFPTTNPSAGAAAATFGSVQDEADAAAEAQAEAESPSQSEGVEGVERSRSRGGTPTREQGEVDLEALTSSIRARYRLLCTSLGQRPRLVAAGKDGSVAQGEQAGVVQGIEGPMKGVDTRQLRF